MTSLQLVHPFSAIIAGPSSSGKTTLATSLLRYRNILITPTPTHVFCFYNHWQPMFDKLKQYGIINKFIPGQPSQEVFIEEAEKHPHSLCLIDDGMTGIGPDVKQMFTELSHHYSCSILLLVQDLFVGHKDYRTCSYNAKYIFIMKNPRNASQIRYLARQVNPSNSKYIIEAYKEATKKPFSYLMIDMTQETPEVFRLRSDVLPHQFPPKLYVRKL